MYSSLNYCSYWNYRTIVWTICVPLFYLCAYWCSIVFSMFTRGHLGHVPWLVYHRVDDGFLSHTDIPQIIHVNRSIHHNLLWGTVYDLSQHMFPGLLSVIIIYCPYPSPWMVSILVGLSIYCYLDKLSYFTHLNSYAMADVFPKMKHDSMGRENSEVVIFFPDSCWNITKKLVRGWFHYQMFNGIPRNPMK